MSQNETERFQQSAHLPPLNIKGVTVQPPHPPPRRNANMQSRDFLKDYWNVTYQDPSILNIKGVGIPKPPSYSFSKDSGNITTASQQSVHLPPLKTKGVGIPKPPSYSSSKDSGNIATASQESIHLPPLKTKGVGLLRPRPPGKTYVRDPDGREAISKVLNEMDRGNIGFKRAAHHPPLNLRGDGAQPPKPMAMNCTVLPPIAKGCRNNRPHLNIRGVGLLSPHPPSDVTPHVKSEVPSILPDIPKKKSCGIIKAYRQSKHLLPLHLRGLLPKPPKQRKQLRKSDEETIAFVSKRLHDFEKADHIYQMFLPVQERDTFSVRCKKHREMSENLDVVWRKESEEIERYNLWEESMVAAGILEETQKPFWDDL